MLIEHKNSEATFDMLSPPAPRNWSSTEVLNVSGCAPVEYDKSWSEHDVWRDSWCFNCIFSVEFFILNDDKYIQLRANDKVSECQINCMETLARSIPQFGKNKYLTNILQIAITEFAIPVTTLRKYWSTVDNRRTNQRACNIYHTIKFNGIR